jgi:hypothetical protein
MQLTTFISHFRGEVKEQPDTDDFAILIKVANDSLIRPTPIIADSGECDDGVSDRTTIVLAGAGFIVVHLTSVLY